MEALMKKKRTASNDLNEISKASKLSKTSKTARESSSKKRSKQPGHSYNQKATHNAAQGQVDRLTGMFIKVHEIIPADKLIDIFQESLNQVLIERKDGGNVVLQNNLALVENSNVSTALFNGLQLEKKEEEKLFSTLRSRIELFLLHNFQSNPELVRQLKQEILNSGGIREELKFVNTEIDEDVEHPNSYELGRGETTEILPDPIDPKRGREYVDGNSNGSVGIVSEMIQVAESTAFRKTNESVAKKTPVVEKNSKITITPEPTPVWRRDVIVDGEAGKVGTGVQLLPRPASLQFDKDAANFNRNSSFYTSEGDNQKKVSVSERWISSHRLKKLKQSHGITYSSGKFTDEEDSIISEAIARVCAQKNWTKDSLLQFLFQKNPNDQEEYNGVWRQICGSITNRPLQAIYHHIKRIYNPKNYKGNWSEAEDNQLFL
ncbi:hypothetical protein AX774_g5388 [Zancudomyces culisetae]|uniref:Myb-like domain-containing protein n=1 Tax=Zancudomyces culisetae TaxID=1213189 RepID=A0A1R1PJL6_ZANCU|nr:hypothetical protein AX774_g5388 [Zancudomyces culisetae]|eukprot:OMH81158.1 hypothetical protein AX774_g5388 [Zancudomyces culisetae]